MATARETIRTALLKLRVLRGRSGTPSSAELADHLKDLNDLIDRQIGFGSSLQWRDAYADGAYTVPADYPALRVLCSRSSAQTITLPEWTTSRPIPDGMRVGLVDVSANAATYNITVARNGMKINALASNYTISSNNASVILMFRADLGDWKPASALTADSDLPFPSDFDLPVALMLAATIMGEYGPNAQLSQADWNAMRAGRQKFYNRYCTPPLMYTDAGNLGGATQSLGVTGQDMGVA